jgi:hypothetical protein
MKTAFKFCARLCILQPLAGEGKEEAFLGGELKELFSWPLDLNLNVLLEAVRTDSTGKRGAQFNKNNNSEENKLIK